MTLETAKQMVRAGKLSKEAEAVVRGGMTICETKEDGSRKYSWIKVEPTLSDSDSSIKYALDKYEKKKQSKRESKHREPDVEKIVPDTQKKDKEATVVESEVESFMNRLKKKAKKIWEEIDSVVIE